MSWLTLHLDVAMLLDSLAICRRHEERRHEERRHEERGRYYRPVPYMASSSNL
jgi:hypothetical protein